MNSLVKGNLQALMENNIHLFVIAADDGKSACLKIEKIFDWDDDNECRSIAASISRDGEVFINNHFSGWEYPSLENLNRLIQEQVNYILINGGLELAKFDPLFPLGDENTADLLLISKYFRFLSEINDSEPWDLTNFNLFENEVSPRNFGEIGCTHILEIGESEIDLNWAVIVNFN